MTSPSPENLRTLFEFVLKGFDAVAYREHEHYEIIQSTNPEFNHSIVRINIFQQHRQTIQVFEPITCSIFSTVLKKMNNKICMYTHPQVLKVKYLLPRIAKNCCKHYPALHLTPIYSPPARQCSVFIGAVHPSW